IELPISRQPKLLAQPVRSVSHQVDRTNPAAINPPSDKGVERDNRKNSHDRDEDRRVKGRERLNEYEGVRQRNHAEDLARREVAAHDPKAEPRAGKKNSKHQYLRSTTR